MRIVPFTPRPSRAPQVAERIARVHQLLTDCLSRQSTIREDHQRLQASLGRLRELTREMVRKQDRLKMSLDRLRGIHRPPRASGPDV
jgi:hypothetical protein